MKTLVTQNVRNTYLKFFWQNTLTIDLYTTTDLRRSSASVVLTQMRKVMKITTQHRRRFLRIWFSSCTCLFGYLALLVWVGRMSAQGLAIEQDSEQPNVQAKSTKRCSIGFVAFQVDSESGEASGFAWLNHWHWFQKQTRERCSTSWNPQQDLGWAF